MLIGVIAAVWVLKSERALISASIEATPINHATYVRARAHIHARGLSWRYALVRTYSSYDRSDEAVAV